MYKALAAIPEAGAVSTAVDAVEVADSAWAEQVMPPFEAYHRRGDGVKNEGCEAVDLKKAVGRISADTVYVYPPGIPQIVSGERISQGVIDRLMKMQEAGATLRGMTTEDRITVLKI